MNDQMFKEKWNEMKVAIQKSWNKISDTELERAKDNVPGLVNLLQDKYGFTLEEAKKRINDIATRITGKSAMEVKNTGKDSKIVPMKKDDKVVSPIFKSA